MTKKEKEKIFNDIQKWLFYHHSHFADTNADTYILSLDFEDWLMVYLGINTDEEFCENCSGWGYVDERKEDHTVSSICKVCDETGIKKKT